MSDEFAVLDFALVAAPPRAVAVALAGSEGPATAERPARKGLLARLFGGRREVPAATAPLLAQPLGTLPPGVLAREVFEDMGFGGQDHEARLSAPTGTAGLTLIELRERRDGAPSPRLIALSAALPEAEVLAFRLTGARHPGGDYGFTVYRGGAVLRRVLEFSREGTGPEADWQVSATGVPHEIEGMTDGDAPPPGMSPARQAELLAALGIDADRLLEDRSGMQEVIELSTGPDGTTPADLPEALPPAAPELSAQAWEDEVTQLLLEAVSDALPEPDQVPWLDALTADLEAGETAAAMARARALLARGHRPPAERAAATDRLAVLFGLPS